MGEQEDSVVEEIDVLLSKPESQDLLLLQYPSRHQDLTYDDYSVRDARSKPKQRKIELELSMNIDSVSYDRSKGAQFVTNERANWKVGEEIYFKGSLMDKHTLVSTMPVSSPNCEYAAGVFRDGELHLIRLQGLVPMRPSFSFLNHDESKGNRDSEALSDSEEEVAKPVQIKFAKRETDRAKQARERSFGFLQQKMEEEPWVKMKYASFGSDESRYELSKLSCMKPEEKIVELHVSRDEYYQMILTESLEINLVKPNLPTTDSLPLSHLYSLPLADQIRSLLKNSVVMQFELLMEKLPANCDPMLVIRNLQQVAVLIHGCWVVKSDVLYPKELSSPHTGVSAETLITARDYIMLRLVHSLKVTREELFPVIKLHEDDMKDILKQIAKLMSSKTWVFILNRDDAFVLKYSDIVHRQTILWTSKFRQLKRDLKIPEDLCQLYEKDTNSGMTDPTAEVESDGTAANGHFDNSLLFKKELRDFVSQTLKVDRCVTMSKLKTQLISKLAQSPPGYVLSRGISTKLYEEVLLEIGAEHVNACWPNVHQQEAIYVLPTMGDSNDPYRRALLDLFRMGPKHRKCNIKKKIEGKTGNQVSEACLVSLLKEYCQYSKSGCYLLKGVVQQLVNSPKRR